MIYDLDRIEALRGPQGTLFGRNANAGVINVISAKPELDRTFGAMDVTFGNYDLTRVKGHFNVPVGSTLALRGAAFVEQREGYIAFLPGSNATGSTPRYDDSDKQASASRACGNRTKPGRCSRRPSATWTAAPAPFP